MMDAICDPAVHTVVIMTSAQVGKTEIINNIIAYFIDQDPSPILLLQPTLQMAQAWSKDRLAPMIRDTPALTGKVADPKARDSGNTILHKMFTGGHLTMAGANSPASLASRPIRILLCDEVDRFPVSAGEEGDPVNLAKKRTTSFWNRKTILVSTPTIMGASRIEAAYEESDKRVAYVTCEDCGHKQVLKFEDVHWDKDEKTGAAKPETAYMACNFCGAVWDDVLRRRMVSNMTDADWIGEKACEGVAGFAVNEFYAPWVKLEDTVRAFLSARKFPELLKTWVNTSLGETWDDAHEKIDPESLMARREPYGPDIWPDELLLVTAGVDTQDDRLEVKTWGYGAEEEAWRLESKIFHGDPADKSLWDELDDWLKFRRYELEDGRTLKIEAVAVDSGGHFADQVVRFCANKRRRRIFAIKGQAGQGKPVWNHKPSRHKKSKRMPVYMVGVDQAKSLIYARLNRVTDPGPGYLHFSEAMEKEHFDQLTAEKVVVRYVKGLNPIREWKQTRERNEELDCAVYAWAAYLARGGFDLLKARVRKKTTAQELDDPVTKDEEVLPEEPKPKPKPAPVKKKKRPGRRKRGGFVNDW
jgi:phage terminase large subunit GpA-like protein